MEESSFVSVAFLNHMTQEDLVEVVQMGEIHLFCNALTLDLQNESKVFNQS